MTEFRLSDDDRSKRDIPSFIEPRPPLIHHPFMRPRPQNGTNLMDLYEEESLAEEPELVQVYLRMRPCNVPSNLYEIRSDKCLLTSLDTTTAGHGRRTQQNVSRMYTFSKIFTAQASQKELFEQVVKGNLKKLPEGHSYTLLTYGASGSGKTYTLMGTVNAPGLVPRSLEYVFKQVDAAQKPLYKPSDTGADLLSDGQQEIELQWVKRLCQVSAPHREKYRRMSAQLHSDLTDSNFDLSNRTKHYVWVSFLEIYNEAIYDLLAPPSKNRTKLRIREDSSSNVYVKDAIQAFVRSGEEAYDVMTAGKQNLSVAATGVHAHSSRSHCIFTITMLTQSDGEIRTSHVRLCDLAGCERARATRNTGARMQESRAINASLHVLERCLHTLRRKQRNQPALVPYRESKLTRLLGSGLSGSRGEAVSMVVTLNPAPQFAQETKHVLSLAAVATDIQINNNTMFAASTLSLESGVSQDTTMETSSEIMKLRADNELLHFELIQAQARNKELMACMEAKQRQNTTTMQELVEEAKAMTRDYYETHIKMLKDEIEELKEELESKQAEVPAPATPISTGTPTRFLQTRVAQLITQIAVLEEKLSAEQLARARAEKEVEHLRACLDERDVDDKTIEKTVEENQEELEDDEIVITDSENEDPLNESLEPIFKKMQDISKLKTLETNSYDSEADKSSDAEKFEDCDTTSKKSVFDETESEKLDARDSTLTDTNDISKEIEETLDNNTKVDVSNNNFSKIDAEKSLNESNLSLNENSINESKKRIARGTYFVKDTDSYKESFNCDVNDNAMETDKDKSMETDKDKSMETDKDKSMETDKDNLVEEISLEAINKFQFSSKPKVESIKPKVSVTTVDKILKSVKKQESIDNSLTQFEKLEMAANDFTDSNQNKDYFGDIEILKEKRTYFNDVDTTKLNKIVTDVENNYQTKSILSKAVEKASDKSYFNNFDENPIIDKTNDQTPNVEKVSLGSHEKDVEITKPIKNYIVNPIINITERILVSNPIKEKRQYFDNIAKHIETGNKIVDDIKESENIERSPSIVKDEFDNYYEPSTSMKLLGDGILYQKPNKKHESVDLFEPDSPYFKAIEIMQDKVKENKEDKIEVSKVDFFRKSIEKLVLEQKTRHEKQLESPVTATAKLAVDKTKVAVITTNITDDTKNKHDSNEPVVHLENPYEKKSEAKPIVTITEQTFNETQNTTAEFENIYKDVSKHRDTEFDIIVTQINNATDRGDAKPETDMNENENTKYNLRKKGKSVLNTSDEKKSKVDNLDDKKNKVNFTEIQAESSSKCEMKPKRNLRLRRRKNQDEETHSDPDQESRSDKLKDLLNLKKEFSDVTMGLPAVKKVVEDIASPEKGGEENVPPPMGIQSCPASRLTRSRRKLFTPRAEPLDESLSQTGDSNERIYVPRPSYHRGRARRKL